MMFMKSSGIASILFIIFIGWVFIAATPQLRMDRTCKPVPWLGSLVTSLVDLSYPVYSKNVDRWVTSAEFSCQYMVWRLFYEDSWVEFEEESKFLEGSKKEIN